eukprot:Gb_15287 [translate_table: standard]
MENPSINDVISPSQEESQHLPTISKVPKECKNKEQWDPRSINILLNKYEEIIVRLDRGHLRVDWKLLALMVNLELGTQWTIYQCKNKMDYMRKKFRREKLKLKRTGSFPRWPYFTRMTKILGSVPENEIGVGAHVDDSCPIEPNDQFCSSPQIHITNSTDENEAISVPCAQAISLPDASRKSIKKRKCFDSINIVRQLNEGLTTFASVMERIQKKRIEMTMTLEREYMDREERHIKLIMQQEERQTKMLLQTQLQIAKLFAQSKLQTNEQSKEQNKDGLKGCS